MIDYDRFDWPGTVFSYRGTALRYIRRRIFWVTFVALIVQILYETGMALQWPNIQSWVALQPGPHAVLGSLLGFLIVFRMNASNNRYWEGRSLWGQMINSSRNLVRAGVANTEAGAELADLISGYVISVRCCLRNVLDLSETEMFLPKSLRERASHFGNPPCAIASAISDWIVRQTRTGPLSPQMARHMEDQLARMVDAQGGCEKIQKTPMPFVYVVMIKQLILVYLLTLPIAVCDHCGWWSPVLVAIVALGLFGMEEASVETENPFGDQENCLDMTTYTLTISRDAGQMASHKAPASAEGPNRVPVVELTAGSNSVSRNGNVPTVVSNR
jgi:putative membrane protein